MALSTVGVLAFGVAGAAATFNKLDGNVNRVDVSGLVGAAPKPSKTPDPDDPNAGQAVNLLVLGSDQRDGVNAEIGGEAAGMRSDTTMLVHISADRSRVEAVSIPRDSLVDIPSCTMSNGKTSKATHGMFNSAFATGWDMGGDMASAAACTIRTVAANTGIQPEHFVVVDFAGFQSMVDAIGGVPICIPNDMTSKDAGLSVKAGNQTLDGSTALAFARARKGKGVGDGSDTNRIGNQQRLVAAMVQEVLSKNVLTDVPKLAGFLNAATSSLTVDDGLSTSTMVGLAYNMRAIRGGSITFMTVPWGPAPSDPNRVVWLPAAQQMWENIANDLPALGQAAPVETTAPTAPATTAPTTAPTDAATAPPVQAEPTPAPTKKAGREAFNLDDTTAVCDAG
ncbi:cell envelope-related function transcriptional attenuator common domain protein [Cellulomonas chitinilytica]|uniref:Cell envelope-related function transcriptional attenuator common domain protein n=1 Tax=Cellulomonas chitinilytica TaxID=398759 RepID=A0A919P5Z7_9CELL|nr:cell envelope-related function transcriptional attenuator common domain protein [Cellulomonas chitinilytica]